MQYPPRVKYKSFGNPIIGFIALGTLMVVGSIGLLLGAYWAMWSLWCWVMPQIWEGGPERLIAPGFWLFCGVWILIYALGNALFGVRRR